MTPEEKLAKGYAQRRAGLLPADPAADEAYLGVLQVVPRDPVTLAPMLSAARALTADERVRVLEGLPLPGVEVARQDEVARRAAEHASTQRNRTSSQAARLRREADRLAAAAAKWRPA